MLRLLAGGVPGPGVVVERSYIPSQPYEIAKNGEKTGGFTHVLAFKSPKTPFFTQKYLTRCTHETFLRNTRIFKLTTYAIADLYLFKVSEVIYAPSRTD